MIYTVEDAGKYWCPWVRGPGGRNDEATCIGAECSQWRWWDPPQADPKNNQERRGYCGIPGKPAEGW